MKISKLVLLLLISLQSFYTQAQQDFSKDTLSIKSLEVIINKAIRNKKVPSVVIAIAKNGQIIYEQAFGNADERKAIKATVRTPYQLASASKPFTATAIMMLYERGLIHIDSPITRYVPGLILSKANLNFATPTVRQLLNHTAGLGTYFDIGYSDENFPFDNFDEACKRYGTIFFNPGTVCEYSNLGYGLLDRIIANVSGTSFPRFMETELFQPLQLGDTYVGGPMDGLNYSASKYNSDGTELPNVLNNTAGAGNIYASVHDLVRFGMFHLGEKRIGKAILSKTLMHVMSDFKDEHTLYTVNKDSFYGLGWYNQTSNNSSPVVWHEGGMPGASSILKLFPNEKVVIAVITNTYNYPFVREITDKLTKIIIPEHHTSPINEIADYKYYTSDSTFNGTWEGNILVEGKPIPTSLIINKNEIILDYSDVSLKSFLTDNQPLPHKTILLYGMVNQGYFVGTTTGILPAGNLRRQLSHLLILKLLRKNEFLSGFVTLMAAADREYYAYPFFVDLKKRK
jgi:CubicO group peptidase (beta-lactamase class C family)